MELSDMRRLEENSVAVKVEHVYKSFKKNSFVLKGMNMTVKKGMIYGLLGPSGCGKTTLLRCLLGRTLPDSGTVWLRSSRPSLIGYMPQDVALQGDLSIEETMSFYGKINSFDPTKIKTRSAELINLLDLPSLSCIVSSLSGGEQRRVSLGVALLHEPHLYILDEPTVGVDPLLSKRIWGHLLYLTETLKRTVIITTHYIEEARQAHIIGLMRSGRLLAQKSPNQLLAERGCENLEQAFLQLCHQVDSTQQEENTEVPPVTCKRKRIIKHIQREKIWTKHRFQAQLIKNILWHGRNLKSLWSLLLLPAVLGFVCNKVLRAEPQDVAVGVIMEDVPAGLPGCLDKQTSPCQNNTHLSCSFLANLPQPPIRLVEFKRIGEAKEAMRAGKLSAVVYFNREFSGAMRARLLLGRSAPGGVLDAASSLVWLDNSNPWLNAVVKSSLMKATFLFVKQLFDDCDISKYTLAAPIKMEKPVFGEMESKVLDTALPPLITIFCFYLPMMFTMVAILMEKNQGIIDRSIASGMSLWEIFSAHLLVQAVLGLVQGFVIFFISYFVYTSPQRGSWFLLFLLICLVFALGSSYGLVMGTLLEVERLATYACVGTMVSLLAVLGLIWPMEGMHWLLRSVGWAVPVIPAVRSYRAIALRGWTILNSQVWFGFLQTSVWILIFCLFTCVVVNLKKLAT